MLKDSKKELLIKVIPPITAIIAITIIECWALALGINGKLQALSYVFIGGLGGYTAKEIKDYFIKG